MAQSKNSNTTYALFAIGAVIVVLILIILVKSPTTQNNDVSYTAAPASVVSKVTSIPASVYNTVGVGTTTTLPKSIKAPALTANGKPNLVYIGAEYCPYCATERWAMVTALARFGTFSNLKVTHSSSTDVYPNTQTFSFHGSTFTSPYLTFTPVEQYSNQKQGTGYATLDPLTDQENSLMNTYDAPPYTTEAGSIPFIDFGGKFLVISATYSPQVLQGQSLQQIADSLTNTSSAISKGAIGSANALTAAICGMTNNQPSNVCTSQTIKQIKSTIGG